MIIGVAGQDGALLAELLLERGYEVVGSVRSDRTELDNLFAVRDLLELVSVDLSDGHALVAALRDFEPNEVYNLSSISQSPGGWDDVQTTTEGALWAANILEAIRSVDTSIRFFQASSSEIFGHPKEAPQDEETRLCPVSPYGSARAYGHHTVGAYRRRYGLFACSGILYNHESWLRPERFVSRKIARAAAAISLGLEQSLELGDLNARRDWSFAGDVVHAAWLMLQHSEPDDYVVASGESHTVGELVDWAFEHVGLDWREHVVVSEHLSRGPAELHNLVGNATKARSCAWLATHGRPSRSRMRDGRPRSSAIARGGWIGGRAAPLDVASHLFVKAQLPTISISGSGKMSLPPCRR